jgi:hypothetical protein
MKHDKKTEPFLILKIAILLLSLSRKNIGILTCWRGVEESESYCGGAEA